MMMTLRIVLTMLLALPLLTACSGDAVAGDADNDEGGGAYTVVATTAMIGDVVRSVAGDRASLHVLMGPGVDPHLYRPRRSDVNRMLRADLVLYNGLHLEGRMTETLERLGGKARAVAEMIGSEFLLAPEEFEGAHDPHVWMDPRGWMKVTDVIAEILAAHDPEYADVYRTNAERYLEDLRELDAYARAAVASIPPERRVLVTAHDAFNYFARAYDIEVEAIQGISTDSEAGLRRIEELVDLLVTRRIGAVFTETSVSDKNMRALLEGAKARGHRIALGGELFSDAMGTDGTYEGTYIGMIDHNVTTIVRALGGEAPARGHKGRLSE